MVTFLFSRERMACLPHAVREPDSPVGKAEVSSTGSLAIPRGSTTSTHPLQGPCSLHLGVGPRLCQVHLYPKNSLLKLGSAAGKQQGYRAHLDRRCVGLWRTSSASSSGADVLVCTVADNSALLKQRLQGCAHQASGRPWRTHGRPRYTEQASPHPFIL